MDSLVKMRRVKNPLSLTLSHKLTIFQPEKAMWVQFKNATSEELFTKGADVPILATISHAFRMPVRTDVS
jgi:hypothetical protein